jgi:hypothetical protein
MVRTLHLGFLTFALTLAACTETKGLEVDGRLLIPADATVVFGFELEPLKNSPLGPMLHTAMQSDPDMKGMLASVPNCNLDLANLRAVFATVTDADDKFMAVVESPGIGTEDNVRCLEKELAKATGKKQDGILMFETKGDVRITPQEDGGYVVILNKNAIAMMDRSWENAVFAAIEKAESRNTTTPLAKAAQAVDPTTDLWFAMALSDSDRAGMGDIEGADGVQVVTATSDLGSGMKLDVALDTKDAANAKTLETSLTELLAIAKPGLADLGLPATLLDTLKLSTAEARVTAKLDIAKDAMPGVMTAMGPLFAAP